MTTRHRRRQERKVQMSQRAPLASAVAPGSGVLRLLRRMVLGVALVLLVLIVFGAALLWSAPATVLTRILSLPPQIETLSGSLWQGRAGLVQGHALDWTLRPADLLRLRIGADIELSGADTLVQAGAWVGWQRFAASDVKGRAGPGLLALADPGLICDSRAVLDVDELGWSPGRASATGEIAIAAGTCTRAGQTVDLPALKVDLGSEGQDAVAIVTSAGDTLGRVQITGDRRAVLRIEPAGAALIPGMPSSAATQLEYPF